MKTLITILALLLFVVSCSPKITTSIVIPKADSPQALAGHKIYTAKCGTCHELKNPEDYTLQKWIGFVNSMAPKAKLTNEEKNNVLAYVQANAKK